MRFLHLGDLHLGKNLHGFDLIDDQRFILEELLDIARERALDAVLIAGDVYDKTIPSEAAVRLFDWFLCRLVEADVAVYIISGNHDSDERLNFGSEIFRSSRVFIAARYEGSLIRETLADEFGPVNIWLMPFFKASQVQNRFPEERIKSCDDAVRCALRRCEIDPDARNVLLAHQFVVGASGDPDLGGSESIATQSVGTLEKVGFDCFDAFDYVALGHIHSPQHVGRAQVRYAGSPLKYSLSEAEKSKFATVVNLGEKGDVRVERVPLHPRRELRYLRGPMAQLLAEENVVAPEDYIYATLTDENPVENAMGIFQGTYPNTVRIEYDNALTQPVERVDISQIGKDRSFRDVISDFYRAVYDRDIAEDELKVMEDVAREAGVIE